MNIKSQDVVVLAKLIAQLGGKSWSQNSMALELCLSPSQINSTFKRLVTAGLVTPYHPLANPNPLFRHVKNFLFTDLNTSSPQNWEK